MENTESKKLAANCQATDPDSGELICNRETWNHDEERCIFHCKEKPVDEFKKFFFEEVEHINSTDSTEVFDGRFFTFPQNINLEGIHFEKRVMFDHAFFSNHVSFRSNLFKQKVSFNEAQFDDFVSFALTAFSQKTDFDEAKFGSGTSFSKAQFGNETSFRGAQFGNKTYFSGAKFSNETDFSGAKFSSETDFDEAKFGSETSFCKAQFGNETSFCGAKFGSRTYFIGAKFGNGTLFREAQFSDETYFKEAQFGDEAYFENVNFVGNKIYFTEARFNGDTLFRNFKYKKIEQDESVSFNNVNFLKPNRVRIENVDLRSFNMVNTDVQNVSFLDCDWPKIGKRLAVFNEVFYSKNQESSLGAIEQLYRRLQLNFENNKLYPVAGDFYIGVMEMRRKQIAQKKNTVWRFMRQNVLSLIAWYRNVSLYGERYTRTLSWILFLLLLFSACYLLAGFNYPETNPPNEKNTKYEYINYDLSLNFSVSELTRDFPKALMVSFFALTFQRSSPFNLTIESRIWSIIESILSAMLLTLFLLAIRRRFRR